MKILGYYHILQYNHWKSVVEDQTTKIKNSGLESSVESIYITNIGNSIYPLPQKYIQELREDPKQFEFPTLQKLYDDAMSVEEDYYLFYIHTKGVSYTLDPNVEDWRNMMDHFILTKWVDCVTSLDSGADCAGVNTEFFPLEPPIFHFSGNFWWARASYIRRLPNPNTLDQQDRFEAEAWIGKLGIPNHKLLYHSHTSHYNNKFPRENYI